MALSFQCSFGSLSFSALYEFQFYRSSAAGLACLLCHFALGYKFEEGAAALMLQLYSIWHLSCSMRPNHSFIAHRRLRCNYGYMLFPPGVEEIALAFPPFVFNLVCSLTIICDFASLFGSYALNRISYRSKKRKTELDKA